MRVLHVITGLNTGGAEAVLYRLATYDDQNEHHIISLTGRGVYARLLEMAGITVENLNLQPTSFRYDGLIKLFHLIKQYRPAVVQTWMYHADLLGGVVARLAGVKNIVWNIRGPYDPRKTSFMTTITVLLSSALSWWLPKVIISNSVYAVKVHRKYGYAKHKFVNVPNGCSMKHFYPNGSAKTELLDELGLSKGITLIGMVARFDQYKDHENLISALSELSGRDCPFVCLLVGTNMEGGNERLIRQIKDCGVEEIIKLLGPREDIYKIMAGLDLHILSSAGESFPNVLVEAMACSTPCVTTDVGDAASIVGATGWIVPRSNPISLAKAIGEALGEMQDVDRWTARRMACRKKVVENYSLDRMVHAYNKIWHEVAS